MKNQDYPVVHLGDRVRDKVSGFTGIVISRTEFIYGCVRIGIQPEEIKDGKMLDSAHFDEPGVYILECIQAEKVPKPPQKRGYWQCKSSKQCPGPQ